MRFLSDYRGDDPGGEEVDCVRGGIPVAGRTLSDEDATRLHSAVVDALAARFGAKLRA